MPKLIDLTGRRFGRLTVLKRGSNANGGRPRWACLCDCGAETLPSGSNLHGGGTRSCGCLGREHAAVAVKIRSLKHGMSLSPEHNAWAHMKQRCFNKNTQKYKLWGGRGITVCPQWLDSFEAFYADTGPRPSPKHSLDRINNDGNYEPGNVRWATHKEQNNNRRRSSVIER